MRRKLRIAIATAGRFHVLDLARELQQLGHNIKFYSYVPRSRACKFGLAKECHVSLLPLAAPAVAWEYLAPSIHREARERLLYTALNRAVIMRLQPCDVFTFMSGIYLEAAQEARRRYGAALWLHRGSRHILSQDKLLATAPGARRPTQLSIQRELEGYDLADRIVVPSEHAEDSFREYPSTHAKLYRNPYGVDLKMFPQTPSKLSKEQFTFLFVGHWSLIKGVDIVVAAIKQSPGLRLQHVGSLGDYPFPEGDSRFSHAEPVQQWELPRFYAEADAFVLASREDGFGVVIGQALASGLPVICSDHTGGKDLGHTPALRSRIAVVPHGNVAALAEAMASYRDRAERGEVWPPLGMEDRESLSWQGYGHRYHDELMRYMARAKERLPQCPPCAVSM